MEQKKKAIEQLSRGNAVDYGQYLSELLAASNRTLHDVQGLQQMGQVQGRAAALQEIMDDFKQAGLTS